MITDTTNATKPFITIEEEIEKLEKDIGVRIQMQKEEIFDSMHRI